MNIWNKPIVKKALVLCGDIRMRMLGFPFDHLGTDREGDLRWKLGLMQFRTLDELISVWSSRI